ncbi:hypothetical protein NDU88_010029 [Pleurodeles waltl]|uniref:Uncharacterized protein n=1 Tax=Pleurodeles waltl TaxID=8319 RepID=A0AAV7S0P6_PLEWA|nr:hypothetical protein NDU88_010029 [Pleurodeles waltl]
MEGEFSRARVDTSDWHIYDPGMLPSLLNISYPASMASEHHNKKEGSLEDVSSKTMTKKLDPPQVRISDSCEGDCVVGPDDDSTPITKSFLEQVFGVLREDFATLNQEISTDVKYLKREITEFGQQIDTVEQTHDAQEEEMDQYRWEIPALQDSNQDLQYHLEDLENQLQHSNIHIRGGSQKS